MTQYGVVLVTAGSITEAQNIAKMLVSEQLAACVNFWPIRSIYTWQGELCDDEEYQLIIKTDLDHFERLAERVQALHSYDVPEVIALPILQGSHDYLAWLSQQVSSRA